MMMIIIIIMIIFMGCVIFVDLKLNCCI